MSADSFSVEKNKEDVTLTEISGSIRSDSGVQGDVSLLTALPRLHYLNAWNRLVKTKILNSD